MKFWQFYKKVFFLVLLIVISVKVNAQDFVPLSIKAGELYKQGKYDSSLLYYQKALATINPQEKADYAMVLFNVAHTAGVAGKLRLAISEFSRLRLWAEGNPSLLQYLLSSIIKSGDLFLNSGQYDSTEMYFEQAKNLIISLQSDSEYKEYLPQADINMWQIQVANGLARLYNTRGQKQKSIAVYQEQIIRIEKQQIIDKADSNQLETLYNNITTAYLNLEQYNNAEIYISKALRIKKSNNDTLSVAYFQSLNNLASIYRYTNQIEKSKITLTAIRDKIRKAHLQNDILYIEVLYNLGEIYLDEEDYEKAIMNFEFVLNTVNQRFVSHHYIKQNVLFALAQSHFDLSQYNEAEGYYLQLMDMIIHDIKENFTYLSEEEQVAYYNDIIFMVESFETFAVFRSGLIDGLGAPESMQNSKIIGDLLDIRMLTRGLVLNASSKMKTKILQSNNTSLKAKYKEWQAKKNELASSSIVESQKNKLRIAVEKLEKELVKESHDFEKGLQIENTSWTQIQQQLKPKEAAVELVRFVNGLFYAAIILTSETTVHPKIVIIKSSKDKHLEEEYFSQYSNSIKFKLLDTVSHNTYWSPIQKELDSQQAQIDKVYLASDGVFHQINVNTLYNSNTNEYLISRLEVVEVDNLNDLIKNKKRSYNTKKALLIGRPNFSNTFKLNRKETTRNLPFIDLEGTEKEINFIAKALTKQKWEPSIQLGSAASEEYVKSLTLFPRIIHFATHGYFVKNEEQINVIQNMLNSGIVLANESIKEDGILTAYELGNLNLDQTELVVLSACETGLGQVAAREGVYGLQRAIKIAGAEKIIMSLWKVDDEATQELMSLFYQQWLTTNDLRSAFRSAQIKLKSKRYHPYYWGAFILVGL